MFERILIQDIEVGGIVRKALGISADRIIVFDEEHLQDSSKIYARLRFLRQSQFRWLEIFILGTPESEQTPTKILDAYEARYGFGGYRLQIPEPHIDEQLVRFWLRKDIPRVDS